MFRALLIVVVPVACLMAGRQEPGWPGTPEPPLGLAPVCAVPEGTADEDRDLAYWRARAEAGDAQAQTLLGRSHLVGDGAPLDLAEARRWLLKAADQGHPLAQTLLGIMCSLGQGGAQDLDQALAWFERAAAQGEPRSQCCLGLLYATGLGVRQDPLEAYVWLLQSLAGGFGPAAGPLIQVRGLLSPAQVEEGERRAAEAMAMRGRRHP